MDPHDGTSAFLDGHRGTAVSIALLQEGKPVLGVVHAPLPPDRTSDTIAWTAGMHGVIRNGKQLQPGLRHAAFGPGNVVFVSQAAPAKPLQNGQLVHPARFVGLPSIAYRLARVACGDGVAAVSLNGPCGWDYAAGHALISGAGGIFVDERGQEVTYTVAGDSAVHWCFGGAAEAVRTLVKRDWSAVRRGPSIQSLEWPDPPRFAQPQVYDRAVGCLMGLLAGDSLGGLVEFQTPEVIASHYPDGVRDMHDNGRWRILAGQPTDDGEMALSLARALAGLDKWDAEVVASAYARWFNSGPFDFGTTTQAALTAASRATGSISQAARAAALRESQANGALMRVAPIGLWASDPEEAALLARDDAALTHPNPVTTSASAAFAAAVATAFKGAARDEIQAAAVRGAGGQPRILKALNEALEGGPLPDATVQEGWVLHAFRNAFYRLWHAPDFETALIQTVGMGGDTDTNAAICGALLGAAHGASAIPERWRMSIMSCRPLGELGARRLRPPEFWPEGVPALVERLLLRRQR